MCSLGAAKRWHFERLSPKLRLVISEVVLVLIIGAVTAVAAWFVAHAQAERRAAEVRAELGGAVAAARARAEDSQSQLSGLEAALKRSDEALTQARQQQARLEAALEAERRGAAEKLALI